MNIKKKMAFASADIYGGGSVNVVNFLYPGFLALVVGLNPFLCGLVMLIARAWDAFSDLLMGRITDKAKNELFGKRRVFMVIAAPLIVLSFVLLFFPFSAANVWLRFSFVLISYIFFCTVQTMVVIPYYAMTSEISSDYTVRAEANTIRRIFNVLASLVMVAVPPIIIRAFENSTVLGFDGTFGYLVMTVVFGVIFAVCVLVTGFYAKEEIVSKPNTKKTTMADFVKPLKVKSFRMLVAMSAAYWMTISIITGIFFFYTDFYLFRDVTASGGKAAAGTVAIALLFISQMVTLPLILKLMKKKSKVFVYRFGATIWILTCLATLLLTPGVNAVLVYGVGALLGFAISGPGVAPLAMMGDVADEVELQLGERVEGSMSGLINLINKVAMAVGVAAMMAILGFFGFLSANPGETVLSQPASAQQALALVLALSPLIILSIGIFFSTKYKIDATVYKSNLEQLEERRKNIKE